MLRKSDWDLQKPCIILLVVQKWYEKRGQQSLKRPATDDRRPTPNPTNKLFQQTLNKVYKKNRGLPKKFFLGAACRVGQARKSRYSTAIA